MRRVVFYLFLAIGMSVFSPTPKNAQAYIGLCCAHCGGNMPMTIMGGGIPETHEFRAKVSQMFMSMGPLRDGTTDITSRSLLGSPMNGKFLVAPSEMRMHMTMLSGAYSFTDDFALMVMGSYLRNDMDMNFNAMATMAAGGQDGFTMHSSGIGDVKVLGKYRLFADDNLAPTNQLSAVFGLSLPSGSINKRFTRNPITMQNGHILPFKMQLGSGTVDPMFGLTYQGSSDPVWYGANLLYTGRYYDNDQGYQQGDEIKWDLYGMYQFHEKALFELQINGHWEDVYSNEPGAGRNNGDGHVGFNPMAPFISPLFDPNNYGFTKINLTAGVQFQPIPLHIIELNASVPIYQDVNGPQLAEDYRIQFTYYIEFPTSNSRRFTGTKAPKELGF